MDLKPITHDVIEGAVVEVFYALICARLEMTDEAISRIERLLTTPFAVDYDDASITLSDLRTLWEWDPLYKDPRFQKILSSPEPKTVSQMTIVDCQLPIASSEKISRRKAHALS